VLRVSFESSNRQRNPSSAPFIIRSVWLRIRHDKTSRHLLRPPDCGSHPHTRF
jgi:hypothetical protein